jgi:hypothetical protein
MPRIFAEDTKVPVEASRKAIHDLLVDWGVSGVRWSDEFDQNMVVLQFRWKPPHMPGVELRVRFVMHIESLEDIQARAKNKDGSYSEAKERDFIKRRGRAEHRGLLLKLKADLNATRIGLVKFEDVFLSHLEFDDGQTVGERLGPRLGELMAGGSSRLALPGPSK